MNEKNNKEVIAFHPGYYIKEIIDDMEMTQEEFAIRLGTSAKTISKLVNGKANISKDLAMKLSNMLNTSPEVWLNLQKQYDIKTIEQEQIIEMNSQIELIREIDYNYFVKLGVLPSTRDWKEKIQNLCSYLSISKLSILKEPDYNLSFRNGIKSLQQKNILSSNIWVEFAIKISKKYDVKPFDEVRLKSVVEKLVEMTVIPLENSISEIKSLLAECGVVLVTIPYLKNSGLHGVVKWLNKEKVLVAISDRRKYTDTFWFTLFHELGHVFQKKIKDVSYTWENNFFDKSEQDADDFAQKYLIPLAKYEKFKSDGRITQSAVADFANEINRDPGIVVGRLQNDKIIEYNKFNNLKTKISESVFSILL